MSEVQVGCKVVVKVGCNEIEAEVLDAMPNGYRVKSLSSGREFTARNIVRIIGDVPKKKLSLLNAAYEVLKTAEAPLNCKEMIAKAFESGLWSPTGGKTPEQSLYGAIFAELHQEAPRFRKSPTRKGAFEIVR